MVYFILSSCESQRDRSAHFVYNVDRSVKCPISRPRAEVHILERRSKQKKDGSFYFFFAELALLMPVGIVFRLDIQLKYNLDPLIKKKIKRFFHKVKCMAVGRA